VLRDIVQKVEKGEDFKEQMKPTVNKTK